MFLFKPTDENRFTKLDDIYITVCSYLNLQFEKMLKIEEGFTLQYVSIQTKDI